MKSVMQYLLLSRLRETKRSSAILRNKQELVHEMSCWKNSPTLVYSTSRNLYKYEYHSCISAFTRLTRGGNAAKIPSDFLQGKLLGLQFNYIIFWSMFYDGPYSKGLQ